MSVPYDGQSATQNVAGLSGENTAGGTGVQGTSDGVGVFGLSIDGVGVRGQADLFVGIGVQGLNVNNLGIAPPGAQCIAVQGHSVGGIGVQGIGDTVPSSVSPPQGPPIPLVGIGVQGISDAGAGVRGESTSGPGVIGTSESGNGIEGISISVGVYGQSLGEDTISGAGNASAVGVIGVCNGGTGVFGSDKRGIGVIGMGGIVGVQGSGSSAGVNGNYENHDATNNIYTYGELGTNDSAGYFTGEFEHGQGPQFHINRTTARLGTEQFAGDFDGNVRIHGVIVYTLSSTLKIDHPLDPANMYLSHSSVESPDRKNFYDGVVVLDANGEGLVSLPAWFEALNTGFRYQLTPIGAPGPNLYIAEEIANNRFRIAGGEPHMKVSWLVTGKRQDAWAAAHPMQIEEEKSSEERGYYLHPHLYGEPEEKDVRGVHYPIHPHRKNPSKELGHF